MLFGKYEGKRITELLDGFETSPYVINYLMGSEDLPIKFKKVIKMIMENYDPFNNSKEDSEPFGFKVREIDPDDDIPY